uniref:HMA domain-containing protein n=1 Tax=Picocystis salinarum TaxID=88271 RepID=A0A6U9PZH7_9CHLO
MRAHPWLRCATRAIRLPRGRTQEVRRNLWRRAVAGQTYPEAEERTEKSTVLLEVREMMCGGCSSAVKRVLESDERVSSASVNLLTGTAAVVLDQKVDPTDQVARDLAAKVTGKGFPSDVRMEEELSSMVERARKRKDEELEETGRSLLFAWGLVGLCTTHHLGHHLHHMGLHSIAHTPIMNVLGNPWISATIGITALLGPGRKILVEGALALLRGSPNMNSLVGLGAVASFLISAASLTFPSLGWDAPFFEEPVMLLAFILLGRSLEGRARARAASDLKALANLLPNQAHMVLDDSVVDVGIASVRKGDVLRVLPGERVPVDGLVVGGRSGVDESMLTGESELVLKEAGGKVSAGSLNWEGPLDVKAVETGASCMISRVARVVEEAQAKEPPAQRLADVVAGKFVYGVMGISALTYAFWATLGAKVFPSAVALAGGDSTLLALKLATDVVVVACPCALGLAAPTAVLVGTSLGAKKGLLLRGGAALERLAQVDTVCLDKTGTLTEAKPSISSISLHGGVSETEALLLAASLAKTTRHPIADALLNEAKHRNIGLSEAIESQTEPGMGVSGSIGEKRLFLGRPSWVADRLQLLGEDEASATHRSGKQGNHAGSTVHLGVEGEGVIARFSTVDTIRSDALSTINKLKDMGIKVYLLSGDRERNVERSALQVGIPAHCVYAGLLPEEKAEIIKQLQANGSKVAMVGDGINDAAALATSDVGIAIRGGMDAAEDAAGVVLMGNKLGQVVEVIQLGKVTLGKIRQNLLWALGYNCVTIPLAAGALLPSLGITVSPSTAGAMMAFSSVAVVSNSLLLKNQVLGRRPANNFEQLGRKAGTTTGVQG